MLCYFFILFWFSVKIKCQVKRAGVSECCIGIWRVTTTRSAFCKASSAGRKTPAEGGELHSQCAQPQVTVPRLSLPASSPLLFQNTDKFASSQLSPSAARAPGSWWQRRRPASRCAMCFRNKQSACKGRVKRTECAHRCFLS